MDGPKVSIVMACHNAADFLAETMDTILAQTLNEWELLASDEASTDQTREILKSYAAKDQRIRLWFFDEKKGPYIRRNFMIERAKAPFISIHDADDLMAPNKLERFYEEINRDVRLGIVGSFDRRFLDTFRGEDFGDKTEFPITHQDIMTHILGNVTWQAFWHGSAIIRKSLFERIGPYDEQPYGSDSFWLAKACVFSLLTGEILFKNLTEFLTFKRQHAQSQTGTISVVDPRSRRARLKEYWGQKLYQIIEEAKESPSMDIAQKLKECTCTDFIPRFKHLFDQWESAPVGNTIIQALIDRVLLQINNMKYNSAVITLNTFDQIVLGKCQPQRNLNFIRGLAYYAIGDDHHAVKNIQQEIQYFRNKTAREFLIRHLEPADPALSAAQRRDNIRSLIEEVSQITVFEKQNLFYIISRGIVGRLKGIKPLKYLHVYWVLRRSGLLDKEYYLQNNPDVAQYRLAPLWHYLRRGWQEGRNPNEFFDTEWYLENYPEVAQSGINPLYHYLKFGWKQNKNPSKNFSTDLYLLYHPDPEQSGMNPLVHYFKYGQDKQNEIFTVLPDRVKKSVLPSRIQNYNPPKPEHLESGKACKDLKGNAQIS